MLPTLVSLGPLSLSSYGVFLCLSFILFSFVVWRSGRDSAIEDDKIFDNLIVVAISAFIGARIFFVLTHWSLFSPNFLYIFLLWRFPGLSWWGGLILGSIVLYFYTLKQKISISIISDSYAKAFPWAMFLMSIGVFFDGTVTGTETNWFSGLAAIGVVGKRHPVGLYAAVLAVIAIGIILGLQQLYQRKKIPRGTISWAMLSLIGLFQLLLAFARSDLLYWQGFSVDYIIATVLFVMPLVPLWRLLEGKKLTQQLVVLVKAKIGTKKNSTV